MTRDVADQLNEVSERYQVPQRLRYAGETAREAARAWRAKPRAAARSTPTTWRSSNPRTSAAAGVILAAAIVGGVLWYIFGTGEAKEPRRHAPRVPQPGHRAANAQRPQGLARTAAALKSGGERTPSQGSPPQGLHPAGVPGRDRRPGRRHPRRPRARPREAGDPAQCSRDRLVLDGDELELVSRRAERRSRRAHRRREETLTIADVPDAFTLETVSRICPQKNTKLEGLYATQARLRHAVRGAGLPAHHLVHRPPGRHGALHHHGARRQEVPGAALERQPGGPSRARMGAASRIRFRSRPTCSRWSRPTWRCCKDKQPLHLRRAGQARPGGLGDGLPEARDRLGREALRPEARPRGIQDRRGRRLQLRRDGEQGPQHLQHALRAGARRHRDRRRLPEHRPRGGARVLPQLDRQPRHLPRLVPACR